MILSLESQFIHTVFTENPITVPGADEKQACVDTTNIQFAYESSQNLDEILHQQYGQVTTSVHVGSQDYQSVDSLRIVLMPEHRLYVDNFLSSYIPNTTIKVVKAPIKFTNRKW